MSVIIDIHADANHDMANDAWLLVNSDNQKEIEAKFQKVWKQVANHFKTYDSHLILCRDCFWQSSFRCM